MKAQVGIGGGVNNVQVSIQTVRDHIVPVLDLVAQQLRSPRFDAAEFDALRREQLAALEQGKSEPQVVAINAVMRRLMPFPKGHALYTSTPDEEIADINATTLEQLKAFHQEFYGASHADVAIVGDFDEPAVAAVVTRALGDWKNPKPFSRAVRTYAAVDSAFVSIETPDKANAMFVVGQNVNLRDDDADYPAMVLANFMMGGGFLNSRIPVRLRQKEGISYGAGTALQVQSLDRYGQFLGYAILNPTNVDRLASAYREEVDRVLKEGFTAQEVEAARTGYVQARSQGRANDNELVGTLVARRFAGRTMAYDENLEKAIMALTPAQVNAAAKKYIDPTKTVIVRAGDFVKNPPAKVTP
jgi:zinc protease